MDIPSEGQADELGQTDRQTQIYINLSEKHPLMFSLSINSKVQKTYFKKMKGFEITIFKFSDR